MHLNKCTVVNNVMKITNDTIQQYVVYNNTLNVIK